MEPLLNIDNFDTPENAVHAKEKAVLVYQTIFGRDDNGVGFNISKYKFRKILDSAIEIEQNLRQHLLKVLKIYLNSFNVYKIDNTSLRIELSVLDEDTKEEISLMISVMEKNGKSIFEFIK